MSLSRLVPLRSTAIGLLLLAGSGEVHSQERRPKDVDRPIGRLYTAPEDVERYVRSQGIGTVEGFLRHLDPMLFANYTLMEHSRSLQTPTSADRPRIILFRPDGRFFVGIATNPESPAYEDVEILALDADFRGQAGAIDFDRRRYSRPTLHVEGRGDDRTCVVCHGPELRPIWGSYGRWTGAFAETATLSPGQAAALTRMLADDNPDENPRLRNLQFTRKVWTRDDFIDLPDRAGGRPTNESMNEAIGGPHLERLWRKMRGVDMADLFFVDNLFREQTGLYLEDADLRRRLDARIDREWRARGLADQFPRAKRGDRPLLMLGLDSSRDLDLPNPFDGGGDARRDQQGLSDAWFYIAIRIGDLISLRYLNEAIDDTRRLRELMAATLYDNRGSCRALNRSGYRNLDDYRVRASAFLWNIGLDDKINRLRAEIPPTIDLRFECMFPIGFQRRHEVAAELQDLVRRTLDKYP